MPEQTKWLNAAAKIDILIELTRKSEPCVCDRCGNQHMTIAGILSDLSSEQIKELFGEVKK